MPALSFVKLQALGNDFVLIDDREKPPHALTHLDPERARALCDRRLGVGADQILWLKSPEDSRAQARMEVWNADGSTSEMCGNGLRAVAAYLFARLPAEGDSGRTGLQIESVVGQHPVEVLPEKGSLRFRIFMGPPRALATELETLDATSFGSFLAVSMGNPHAVFWVEPGRVPGGIERLPLEHWGPRVENHPRFAPQRTNAEWVEKASDRAIRVRVWERGAGLTQACGSGACASAVAAMALGHFSFGRLEVQLPGGTLWVEWSGRAEDPVTLEGTATEVFSGVLELPA
jgi:diaminopimelate epimerase